MRAKLVCVTVSPSRQAFECARVDNWFHLFRNDNFRAILALFVNTRMQSLSTNCSHNLSRQSNSHLSIWRRIALSHFDRHKNNRTHAKRHVFIRLLLVAFDYSLSLLFFCRTTSNLFYSFAVDAIEMTETCLQYDQTKSITVQSPHFIHRSYLWRFFIKDQHDLVRTRRKRVNRLLHLQIRKCFFRLKQRQVFRFLMNCIHDRNDASRFLRLRCHKSAYRHCKYPLINVAAVSRRNQFIDCAQR